MMNAIGRSLKHLFFGAMAVTVAAGAVTYTARPAHAAENCDPCPLENGWTGYLVTQGPSQHICVGSADPLFTEQCGVNS